MATSNIAPTYYYRKYLAASDTFTLDPASVLSMSYVPETAGTAQQISPQSGWEIAATPPEGLDVVTNGAAFVWGGDVYFSADGSVFRGFHPVTGATTAAGSASTNGVFTLTGAPSGPTNSITWGNLAHDQSGGLDVLEGVFRVDVAPIKAGSFQLQAGSEIGAASSGGILSGDFAGTVDFVRGIVRWQVSGLGPDLNGPQPVRADEVTYNAVYLQYVPLDEELLGLSTVRLPLDGRAPIYRAGDQVLIHNTLDTTLVDPIVKNTAYSLGRQRIAVVVVRDALGVRLPAALYNIDFNAGTITIPTASDISSFTQPFTVSHRIEDELLVLRADISGKLDLVAGITHDYPAGTSYVSSKLRKGDLFARAFNYLEQVTWTGVWSDALIGSAPTANYNDVSYPVAVSNRGAITERWAIIFTSTTAVRVVGEEVGQILTNVPIAAAISPINPTTGAPYFTVDPAGWGGGWATGNVLRFNTAACGSPAWVVRTVLQGPPSVQSDQFTLAFRSDVDA